MVELVGGRSVINGLSSLQEEHLLSINMFYLRSEVNEKCFRQSSAAPFLIINRKLELKRSKTQFQKYTSSEEHKYKNTLFHKFTSAQVNKFTST